MRVAPKVLKTAYDAIKESDPAFTQGTFKQMMSTFRDQASAAGKPSYAVLQGFGYREAGLPTGNGFVDNFDPFQVHVYRLIGR